MKRAVVAFAVSGTVLALGIAGIVPASSISQPEFEYLKSVGVGCTNNALSLKLPVRADVTTRIASFTVEPSTPDAAYQAARLQSPATAGLYNFESNVVAVAMEASPQGSTTVLTRRIYRQTDFCDPLISYWKYRKVTTPDNSMVYERRVDNLVGADRYETSAKIAKWAYPQGTKTVYLARGDILVDALSAGTLDDGPVLLVPKQGAIPASVKAEIERINPTYVVALGGAGAVSDEVLNSAAGARSASRIWGKNRAETSLAIAKKAWPDASYPSAVYLADAIGDKGQGSPDAVAGGVLTGGPLLLVDKDPDSMALIKEQIAKWHPSAVYALGGTGVLSTQVLTDLAGSISTSRLAGADRYETSVEIARFVAPTAPAYAYLASGEVFADAVVTGAVKNGPILLTHPGKTGTMPTAVRDWIKSIKPDKLAFVGAAAFNRESFFEWEIGKDTEPVPTPSPSPTPQPDPTSSPTPTP